MTTLGTEDQKSDSVDQSERLREWRADSTTRGGGGMGRCGARVFLSWEDNIRLGHSDNGGGVGG
ncbi:hypothetical protein [Nocardia xishanensis]